MKTIRLIRLKDVGVIPPNTLFLCIVPCTNEIGEDPELTLVACRGTTPLVVERIEFIQSPTSVENNEQLIEAILSIGNPACHNFFIVIESSLNTETSVLIEDILNEVPRVHILSERMTRRMRKTSKSLIHTLQLNRHIKYLNKSKSLHYGKGRHAMETLVYWKTFFENKCNET